MSSGKQEARHSIGENKKNIEIQLALKPNLYFCDIPYFQWL